MRKKMNCIYCDYELEEVICDDVFYDNITIKNIPTLVCKNKDCNDKYYLANVMDNINKILENANSNDIFDYNDFK